MRRLAIACAVLVTGGLLASCSQVSMRGAANFGVDQVFISQAGHCNNKVTISKGKIDSSTQSDGWSLIDKRTNKLVRISGDSIIEDATPSQVEAYLRAPDNAEAQRRLLELLVKEGTILPEPKACSR